jgi:lipopolysaccharide export system permease protein
MLILHRYVLSQLLWVGGLLLFGLTILLVFVGVADQAGRYNLGGEEVTAILPFVVPSLMPFTIPATLLLTVCVVYGRMASEQEITAAKAAGINVLALLMPSFVLSALLSLGTFILTDQVIPWSQGRIEQIVYEAFEKIFLDQLREKQQWKDNNHGIDITVMRVEGKKLVEPLIRYCRPDSDNPITVQAEEAAISFDLRKQVVLMEFKAARVRTKDNQTVFMSRYQLAVRMIDTADQARPRGMRISQIRQELEQIKRRRREMERDQALRSAFALTLGRFDSLAPDQQANTELKLRMDRERFNKLNTEVHSRIALAFGCLFFAFVGSPFAIVQAKRQFLTNFFLCFAPIIAVYYPTVLLSMNLAKYDFIDPAWGMWGGNLLLALWGSREMYKVLQH